MEKFQQARAKAVKNYKTADHIFFVTYPLVKDSKILLNVLQHVFKALAHSMTAIIYYDQIFKYTPSFPKTFQSKFEMFKGKSLPKHNIDKSYPQLIKEIQKIIQLHKESPVEFRKKDRFIICTDNYRVKAITADRIKKYMKKTKSFLEEMRKITSENEQIFNR